MNELTVEELEITLLYVAIGRIRLSPVPSNDIEKSILKNIESKLEKDLKRRKKEKNERVIK